MNALYLVVNLVVIGIPMALSWHPDSRFVDQWRSFWPACLSVMAFFVIWDVIFTANGIWGFEEAYLIGLSLAGLPIEEWLFFVTVPYACVFTYYVLGVKGGTHGVHGTVPKSGETSARSGPADVSSDSQTARWVSGGITLLCLMLAVMFWGAWYTTTTALFCSIFGIVLWIKRPVWQGLFLKTFLILMIPFLLTNGVLTGLTFWIYPILNTDPGSVVDQIVWYDNAHNMGIRLFSIPLDDFFYGFLLIGMNVFLFEALRSKKALSAAGG